MIHREWFRLSHLSLFLLISTLPIQSADKVLFGAKAIWDVTLSLIGVGALTSVKQPVEFPVSPQKIEMVPVSQPQPVPSPTPVTTDAGSVLSIAKAVNDVAFDTKNDPVNKWDELRQQQQQRQLDLKQSQMNTGMTALTRDKLTHPEKYNEYGQLKNKPVYGFGDGTPHSVAPVTNAKASEELYKQATTVTSTALVMMTQLAPVVSSQAPLIASLSTEATKTRAVGDMLEMIHNPAPEVNPAMIAFLKDGTIPATATPAAQPSSLGPIVATGGTLATGALLGAGKGSLFAASMKGVAITAAAIGVAPATLIVGGAVVVGGGAAYLMYRANQAEQNVVLQKQQIVQNGNNSSKKDDNNNGGPKKPKKDYSDTVADLAEKIKKAKDLADEVAEEAKKRGWQEPNMPDKNDKVVMNHIFNKNEGHDLFTEENYASLQELVKDPNNFVGKDEKGVQWFAKPLQDGKQRWAYAWGDKVKSGGTNMKPANFCPKRGMIKDPIKPIIPTTDI